MKISLRRAILFLCCALIASTAFGQWPTSAADNLLICDHTGEQTLPKIAATSDGGCYIAWYDHQGANYDVYLQRLNEHGVPQWTHPCGMLVSNHTQETWITDWDMTVDLEDHCIIAVNDIRSGGDWDIYGYRISPAGVFVWGADGLTLSDNANFEATPVVTVTSGGNIAFAWQEETAQGMVTRLRKVTTAGLDVFTAGTITISREFAVTYPKLAAGADDQLLMQYLVAQGSEWWASRHIYIQKYDSLGLEQWVEAGAAVMTTDGIGVQMIPDLIYDGEGGAYSYWYDTRDNVHHCYVQHLNNTGAVMWTANGVQTDLTANERQMSPSLVHVADGVVMAYLATNSTQSLGGVQAQKLNLNGELQWGTNGVELLPLSNAPAFNLKVLKQNGYPTVFYSQYTAGSAVNTLLYAAQIDYFDGSFVWTASPRALCSVVSEKGRPHVCVNINDQLIAAWPDSRIENGDIYVQNINLDGNLGPFTPPPPALWITAPPNGVTLHWDTVTVAFDVQGFTVAPNSEGDGVAAVFVNGETFLHAEAIEPFVVSLDEGETEIAIELLDNNLQPLVPRVADTIHVTYTVSSITITSPAQDTTVYSAESIMLAFDVQNFAVSETGDGCIFFDVSEIESNGDTTFVSESILCADDPILYTFGAVTPETEYLMSLTLMDDRTDPATPVGYDDVRILWDDLLPSITITSPAQDSLFWADSITIWYDIENFDVAEFGGDGWIHVLAWYEPLSGGDTITVVDSASYQLFSMVFDFAFYGEYTYILTLVDNDGEPLIPNAADTVNVSFQDISADERPNGVPGSFALHAAYPNPFNPETTLRYDVQKTAHVTVMVHDLLGRTVATLVDDSRDAGSYAVVWRGLNQQGASVPSGVYFARMISSDFIATQKLMLIR